MKKIGLLIGLLFMCSNLIGQDLQFSQFYASPLFLNPAFAGSSGLARVGLNFRNQWPSLDHSFVSFSAYGDLFIEDKNSGLGMIVNGSRESMNNLQNMEAGLLYSYRLRVGDSRFLHFGAQGSYVNRSVNLEAVVLGTQLDIDTGQITGGNGGWYTDESTRSFADFNAGILYYGEQIWFGASGHHLTRPEMSFLEGGNDRLPIRYSFHGGIKFDLEPGFINDYFNNTRQERTISFAFNYKQQGAFDQLDLGTELFFDPIILGLWYRGLPSKNALPNNEAIIALVGFSLPSGLDLGYSYDFTLSKLGWRNSGGAHEISFRYSFVDAALKNSKGTVLPSFRY